MRWLKGAALGFGFLALGLVPFQRSLADSLVRMWPRNLADLIREASGFRGYQFQGRISGIVYDTETGAPIPGLEVYLRIENGGCPNTVVRSDPKGHYSFYPLEPGKYGVFAKGPGFTVT